MPSQKVLEEKKAVVSALTDRLQNSVAGVVVSYKGINVADDTKLRKDLREAGVQYTVVKNTAVLEGTTALATSAEDHVAAARILSKFADKNKDFKIKSGYLDGAVISLDTISSLAKLPSREILLATVCNAFNAPIASLARALQAIVDNGGVEETLAKKAAGADAAEAPAEA